MSNSIDAEKEIEDWMARLRFEALTEEEECMAGKWFSEDDEYIVLSKETDSTLDSSSSEMDSAASGQYRGVDAMIGQPKCRNQWAEINAPRSREGLDALRAVVFNAKPLPGSLIGQIESKSFLVLTKRTHCIAVDEALKRFARVAPNIYGEVARFYEKQGVTDSEWMMAKEIIRILMASHAGQDFYVPYTLLPNDEYQCARIVRLSGTSPYGL